MDVTETHWRDVVDDMDVTETHWRDVVDDSDAQLCAALHAHGIVVDNTQLHGLEYALALHGTLTVWETVVIPHLKESNVPYVAWMTLMYMMWYTDPTRLPFVERLLFYMDMLHEDLVIRIAIRAWSRRFSGGMLFIAAIRTRCPHAPWSILGRALCRHIETIEDLKLVCTTFYGGTLHRMDTYFRQVVDTSSKWELLRVSIQHARDTATDANIAMVNYTCVQRIVVHQRELYLEGSSDDRLLIFCRWSLTWPAILVWIERPVWIPNLAYQKRMLLHMYKQDMLFVDAVRTIMQPRVREKGLVREIMQYLGFPCPYPQSGRSRREYSEWST